jgi:hypothetical protein
MKEKIIVEGNFSDENSNEFILEFTALIKKHKACIYYTRNDDGVHIDIDGEDVFTGTIEQGDMRLNCDYES